MFVIFSVEVESVRKEKTHELQPNKNYNIEICEMAKENTVKNRNRKKNCIIYENDNKIAD